MSKHIVVIGGGPAGIEAAKAAGSAGARVTLVSDSPVGGRAGWHSLLPSKVWLTAADTAGLVSEADTLGVTVNSTPRPNPAAILPRIKAVAQAWNSRQVETLKSLGVELVAGLASFEQAGQVVIKDSDGNSQTQLNADAFIIAAGSVPFFPPTLKPDGKRILAPRFASHLDPLPPDIVVIGAGPTGSEFVYLFNRLGVNVIWVVDQYGVLPTFAPAAGNFLADTLARRGVKIASDQLAEQIEQTEQGIAVLTSAGKRYPAAMAFVAIGRFPDLSRLNLAAAGLQVENRKAPPVDQFGRTAVPGIYAVGDAAGAPMVANRAMAQAWVAGRHAAGADTLSFRPDTVISATYTEPQVAQVGTVAGDSIQTVRVSFADNLKAGLLAHGEGFLDLAFDDNHRITGGVAVGPHAADALAPVGVAVQQSLSVDELAAMYGAHPTVSELAFVAARSA